MLPTLPDYASLMQAFRWAIPDRYNIGVDVCDRWASVDPRRPAIIEDFSDRVAVTDFGTLRARSNQLAHALLRLGLARGDRVAILLPPAADVVASHIAIYKLGAIALPLASVFGVDALDYRLRDAGVRAVITNAGGVAKLVQIRAHLPALEVVISTDGADGSTLGFDAILETASAEFEPVATGPDDPAMMIYTSGTTGQPKGALHGHRVLLGHLPGVQFPHEFFPQPGDLAWTPADWAWAGGLLNMLLPSLHFGVAVVAKRFEGFDPEAAYEMMARLGVRNAFIPPTALRMMRAVAPPSGRHSLQLRTLVSAGEALGAETYAWGREVLGLAVNESYGQTECNLVFASCAAIGVSRAGSMGKVVPGHVAGVIRADGRLCAPGETGQIAIRRPDPVMFLGYWNQPDATAKKFVDDWMITGDQARCDEDGYVFFVGRDDDIITSSGYRIGPSEIEDCLLRHPAVAVAAAVGKPDALRTEIVKAFIVLRPGVSPSDELVSDIQTFVRQRLSAHEYPREIAFVPSLPLTTTGKVIRRLLREQG